MKSVNMRIAIFVLVAFSGSLVAQAAERPRSAAETSVVRGLDFLAKDAVQWKKDHNCASCHHASNIVMTMHEAKRRNLRVDEPLLAELTKWLVDAGDGKTSVPRPASAPRALNTRAMYFAFGLSADPDLSSSSKEGFMRMLNTVKGDQLENGSWSAWPETRPPYFGDSDEIMTLYATLALTAAAGDESVKVARDKGVKWLVETKTDDDPQSMAMRLVLWKQLDRSVEEIELLVVRIKQGQNADGGWSQAREMPSDAWATGQALYALSYSGLNSSDPAIQRGQTFLVQTQREDGSWPMTSRPTVPSGSGSTSLIPIIGGGTSWAVMGLVRSYEN